MVKSTENNIALSLPNSGNLVSGQIYTDILTSMVVVGCLVVVKRLLASFMLGKKKYGKIVGPSMR